MTDHLRRSLAPVTDTAWKLIEEEARRTLRHFLAARPLVDFTGPKGWAHSCEPLGRTSPVSDRAVPGGVTLASRQVQPLVELRRSFDLSLQELDRADKGGTDLDLSAVSDAARDAALAEDRAVFDGIAGASIPGIATTTPHQPVTISDDYDRYPEAVARAVAALRRAGVGGPYAIALGPRCYTGVTESTEHGGYPVLEHVKLILGGPVVWAPAVDGAVVLSVRGGDFEFVSGQDFSIGFSGLAGDRVELFLEESFTFVVKEPRAAVALRYPAS